MIPQKTCNKIHAVLMDMDGVMFESFPFLRKAVSRLFHEKYGVTVEDADFQPFAGSGEASYLEGIARRYQVQIDLEADLERTFELYEEHIQGALTPLPGVIDFIMSSRAGLLGLALVTSSSPAKVRANLREARIPSQVFDTMLTRADVEKPKPDPALYRMGARRLGRYPSECLVIEDSPNGIRAAVDAGCPCLAVTTTFDEATLRAAGADWVAPDLTHVNLNPVIATASV